MPEKTPFFNGLLDDLYGPKQRDGTRDVEKRIVEDTRDLSRLGRVLDSEKATAELRAGKTLEEAEIYVDTREESIQRLVKVTKELGVLVTKKLLPGTKGKEGLRLLRTYKDFDVAVKVFVSKEP